jgi:hypothetical protein
VHFQDQRVLIDAADGRQIAREIEAEIGVEHPVDDIGIGEQQQRVAVWCGIDDGLGGDLLSLRALVLDHERPAEPLRQHLSGEPRDNVGGAAGWKTDQKAYRSRRIRYRRRRRGSGLAAQAIRRRP